MADGRIYVGNLPIDVQERDIEDLFFKYGKIRDIELKNNRGTIPFAFVRFEDPRLVLSYFSQCWYIFVFIVFWSFCNATKYKWYFKLLNPGMQKMLYMAGMDMSLETANYVLSTPAPLAPNLVAPWEWVPEGGLGPQREDLSLE